jgi:purine-cytosine permease-like protein
MSTPAVQPRTRAYQAADVVPTALSHLLMSRLEGYLSSLGKYYLPFYLVLYAAFLLYHRRFRRVHH